MRLSHLFAISAVSALALSTTTASAQRYHHHHNGNGAAVGAALGAGVFLGALAATSAANAREEEVYIEAPPPPPPPVAVYGRDRGEEANEALAACRRGLLDAARKYGAYDAEIGDIYSVRETPEGHRVRAEITVDYPRASRTSVVTCDTEDGVLVSARSED